MSDLSKHFDFRFFTTAFFEMQHLDANPIEIGYRRNLWKAENNSNRRIYEGYIWQYLTNSSSATSDLFPVIMSWIFPPRNPAFWCGLILNFYVNVCPTNQDPTYLHMLFCVVKITSVWHNEYQMWVYEVNPSMNGSSGNLFWVLNQFIWHKNKIKKPELFSS